MSKQLELKLRTGRGGFRKGSGRKKIHSSGVAHRARKKVNQRHPMHINFKYRVPIRSKLALRLLKRAILNARSHGLRIIHYSLQSNHIHLIVEASNNEILTKGLRSLTVTFAKGLKQGRVQLERYHLHVLKSLKEAQNAIKYVLLNEQKHGHSKKLRADGYSSLSTLGHACVLKLIRKEKLSLIWEKADDFFVDVGKTWLYSRSIFLIVSST